MNTDTPLGVVICISQLSINVLAICYLIHIW